MNTRLWRWCTDKRWWLAQLLSPALRQRVVLILQIIATHTHTLVRSRFPGGTGLAGLLLIFFHQLFWKTICGNMGFTGHMSFLSPNKSIKGSKGILWNNPLTSSFLYLATDFRAKETSISFYTSSLTNAAVVLSIAAISEDGNGPVRARMFTNCGRQASNWKMTEWLSTLNDGEENSTATETVRV